MQQNENALTEIILEHFEPFLDMQLLDHLGELLQANQVDLPRGIQITKDQKQSFQTETISVTALYWISWFEDLV